MPRSNFVHLHTHTEYSLLDGALAVTDNKKKPGAVFAQAYHFKMPALAITDHGNLFGAIQFYHAAETSGIKPIIGCEVYVAPKSRFDKTAKNISETSSHLTLLAQNETGYRNLLKLVTLAYLEGFYYRPRIDKELLSKHSNGLIALSGCLKGEIQKNILKDDLEAARKTLHEYGDIFEKGNFFLEVQNHNLPEDQKVIKSQVQLSKSESFPLVATNDCHYLTRDDSYAHEILMCIGTGKKISDPDRMRFSTNEFYFKSPQEMENLFSEIPQAIVNTVKIAEQCNLELDFSKTFLPYYKTPSNMSSKDYLEKLCFEGLKKRYENVSPEIRDRLSYELKIINQMGFPDYFLIVWDFIQYARHNKIPVGPGRGSGAGSLVSYCLQITDIDPLKYGLLFERFLNPERVTMPDLDIDFSDEGRDSIIQYVKDKYGHNNVAQIVTFGTLGARAVVRDVGRVMDIPLAEVDKIAKLIPSDPGINLAQALLESSELKKLVERDDSIHHLYNIAIKLEGLTRHISKHAAGIVISKDDLTNHLPFSKSSKGDITTQYDANAIGKLGLLKFDFLGIRTLTVIYNTIKVIKRTINKEINIDLIPINDNKTYTLLSAGNAIGVFQLESSGMRDLLRKLKPTTFEDVIALVSLYRPGPMGSGMVDTFVARKHNKEVIKYEHPSLIPILKQTYGICVYQEQVIQIASQLAGFTPGQADLLRRAMGKKIPEEIEKQRIPFIEGALKKGIKEKKADKIFEMIAKFGGYGFNKCLPGYTRIINYDTGKYESIDDIYQQFNKNNEPDQKSNARINTLTCTPDFKLKKGKITDIFDNGDKTVYRVTTKSGKSIEATYNHPFLTFYGFKYLSELRIGDKVAITRHMPIKGRRKIPDYKIIVLGYLLSAGNIGADGDIYYYSASKHEIDEYAKNIIKFSNTEISFGKSKYLVSTRVKHPLESEPGVIMLLKDLNLMGVRKEDKFIPDIIFELSNEKIALFIGKLWMGGGVVDCKHPHFNDTTKYSYRRVSYTSCSGRFINQLQYLLARLNISSHVNRTRTYKDGRVSQTLVLNTYEDIVTFASVISPYMYGKEKAELLKIISCPLRNISKCDTLPREIYSVVQEERRKAKKKWKEIEREIGLSVKGVIRRQFSQEKDGASRKIIEKLAKSMNSSVLQTYVDADITYDSIISIEEIGIRKTYDLTVETTHNFVANDFIVHNSHASAYAMLAYQTAYLKANHTVEYMASLLTSEMGNSDKIALYISECSNLGIKILPPDINESRSDFTVVDEGIRFGLVAVKNVGTGAVQHIVEIRKQGDKFASFDDFCQRIDIKTLNKRVLESLIKCGAFDSLQVHRKVLFDNLQIIIEKALLIKKDKATNQTSFFDIIEDPQKHTFIELLSGSEWPENKVLEYEKEVLGFYVTGHPLAKYAPTLNIFTNATIENIADIKEGTSVRAGGIITRVKHAKTKKGETMAVFELEDLSGKIPVVLFPSSYNENIASQIYEENMVIILGTVNKRRESPQIILDRIIPISQAKEKLTSSVHILIKTPTMQEETLENLKDIFNAHKGLCPVYLHLEDAHHNKRVIKPDISLKVLPNNSFSEKIEHLLGKDRITYTCNNQN